jgi:hypothetical protein
MDKVKLMFDGKLVDCHAEEDRFGRDYLFVTDDGSGRFAKFSKEENLQEAIDKHNEVNGEEVEIIPDVEYGEVTTFDAEGNEVK